MNATATLPAKAPTSAPVQKPRKPVWLRIARLLLGLILVAFVALAEPHIFRFLVRQLISFEAYRLGGSANIERVDGSLWEPVSLINARWFFPFERGSVLRVETDRVQAVFDWRELLNEDGARWFRRLSIEGVHGKLELPTTPTAAAEKREERRSYQIPVPARVDASAIDLVVAGNGDSVRFQNGSFVVSELEPGVVQFEQIVVRQPWLSRIFRDVKGTTAVQGTRLVVADLTLEESVKVASFAAEMADLAEGDLNAEVQIAAFGGSIRAQARTLRDEKYPGIEASGTFSQIGVAPLATFLSVSEAAGGTIKDGKFTFRGSPRNVSRAAASIRFQAVNFQWESRQWDSLVLGATLLDRRVQIPELELHQGHNRLSLNGDMALPIGRTAWWQSDFSFNIAAKIENLTEVSALLLPEFKYAAGKMNIDGAVRGKNQQFNGALIVSGYDITWRNAPIEELHAALKITGNELQVANFELLNKDDFVRGRGVVNILGAKQYWGELRASVADLASYAALLQPPIVPEPLAGGAVVNWSGEGSAKAHSGKFEARLQKLRTLGATGANLHPLQADLEGAYEAGRIQFSRFALSDDQSAFTANVTVGNKALSLQGIRLTHGSEVWLEGDAVLPLDVWRAWPNTALPTLLAEGVPSRIKLTANKLQLRDASRLTGWKWPIEGIVEGTIEANGAIGSLNTNGRVTLENARLPLGWSGGALTNVSATLSLAGQALNVEKFTCSHGSDSYSAEGQIDFTNVRDTTLKLALKSEASTFAAFKGITLPVIHGASNPSLIPGVMDRLATTSKLDLQIHGIASAAAVTGTAQLTDVSFGGAVNITPLWKSDALPALPALFQAKASPWRAWKLDVAVKAENASATPTSGSLAADLRLTGTGGAPVLTGRVDLKDAVALAAKGPIKIEQATVLFREAAPAAPSFELRANGEIFGSEFNADAFGTFTHPIREIRALPPLTDAIARDFLTEPASSASLPPAGTDVLSFSAPAALTGGAPVYPWEPIVLEEPAPAEPAQEAPTTTPTTSAESATPTAGTNPLP